jgi:HPt (histidine-containing phosphotransfer) domain-containing protein
MLTDSQDKEQAIADTLSRMLTKFLPDISQRVSLLETAVQALAEGRLTAHQRSAAHAAAHKLAGTLGMFGMHSGTELARAAELTLAGEEAIADPEALGVQITQLRQLIDSAARSKPVQ